MDLNNCLCKIVNSFITYSTTKKKIIAGFFTYREFLDEKGKITNLNAILKRVDVDLFLFFLKCGAVILDWTLYLTEKRINLLKHACLYNPFKVENQSTVIKSPSMIFTYKNLIELLIEKNMRKDALYFFDTYRKSHFDMVDEMDIAIDLNLVDIVKKNIAYDSAGVFKCYSRDSETTEISKLLNDAYFGREKCLSIRR